MNTKMKIISRALLFFVFISSAFAANPPLPAGAYYSHLVPNTYIVDINQNLLGTQSGQGADSYFGPAQQGVQYFHATATGTGDAIVVSIPNITTLSDWTTIGVVAIGQNLTTTPYLYLNGFGGLAIVKANQQPLLVGDIVGAGEYLIFQYNAKFNNFVLQNAATSISGAIAGTSGTFTGGVSVGGALIVTGAFGTFQTGGALTGALNGSNQTYTLPQIPKQLPPILINGLGATNTVEYTLSGATLTHIGTALGATETITFNGYQYKIGDSPC